MASKRKPKASKGEEAPRSPHKDLLQRIRDRYHVMVEADQENRRKALEDLKFVNEPGAQWDANMKKERGDRPCYEFNKLRINGKRVINEIRANRPQGKVRAVEGGDKKTAELYEGLCRNIANQSDLDTITDNAAEYQVDAGMACWRVVRKYAADDVFDQDLRVDSIKNPFCLWWDPAAKDPLKRDAEDWILEDRISKEAFEAKYKGKEVADFSSEGGFDDQDEWTDEHTVRVVEYWYKEPYDKEIWLMAFPQEDGSVRRITVDSTTDEADAIRQQPGYEQLIERKRVAQCNRIMMCVASGEAILEKPTVDPGAEHPFIVVFGETKVIEGKTVWWGLHRFAKDAQQSYNISRTSIDETIAGAPKEFFWATPKQAEGHTALWSEAHRKNFPFKLYNPDPEAPQRAPERQPGAQVPVALLEQAMVASQDIRDVTGLHEASFGEESDEKSGIALARKQSQAQIVTYNFPDNMAKGVKRTWEILIDKIPHVYDAERELRVLGSDGAEDYVKVNQLVQDKKTGKTVRVNDVTHGKYDVTITTGPSFATMRQEAAEVYSQLFPPESPMYPFVADLVAKSFDYPYSDKIAKRLLLAAPPAVQQMESDGKDLPPEAQQAMAKAEQAMAQVQQQAQIVQQAAQEVQQDQAKSKEEKSKVEIALARLDAAKADFEAQIAKDMAALQIKEAQISAKEVAVNGQQQQNEAGAADLSEAQKAVAQIDQTVAQFMQAAAEILKQIDEQKGATIVMPAKPRRKLIRSRRENGELVGEIEYEDGGVERYRSQRQPDGSLVAVAEDQMPNGMMQ